MKFEDLKVGMTVTPNSLSDEYYLITCKNNEWEGVVININEDDQDFDVRTTKSAMKDYINRRFVGLEPKAFDEVKPATKKPKTTRIITVQELVKVVRDKDSIIVLYHGKEVARATCAEDDNYNEEFGLNIALRRFCAGLADTNEKIVKTIDHVEDFI